jgi:hypothetical protein
MDGWKCHVDPEVRALRRKKLIVQWPSDDRQGLYCPFSWHLTERGARLIAPEAFAGDAA